MADSPIQSQWDLDERCDHFEAEWKAGRRPKISKYISGWNGKKEELFRHLLELDNEYRLRAKESVRAAEYEAQFPQFKAVIEQVLRRPAITAEPLTPREFAQAIVAANLLSVSEVKELWAKLSRGEQPKSATAFSEILVRQGKLTEFQARELLSGSNIPFFLGDYELLARIGAGGMGQVFQAKHRHMDRLVAVKLLPPALTKSADMVKRFQREVKAAAKLSHPNIVAALDASVQRGTWYLVMEYVAGADLAAVVKAQGALPLKRAVECLLQTSRGLAYAHRKGVIHRDIKPANLLLTNDGIVKILDMGLARIEQSGSPEHEMTSTGQVMGTVDYMAPEQAVDVRTADARSDLYSLGCTLYRLLTGENTYGGDSVVSKLMAHAQAPIPSLCQRRPDVPVEIDRIFQKLIAKRPQDRFQTAEELIHELKAWDVNAQPTAAHSYMMPRSLKDLTSNTGSQATNGGQASEPTVPQLYAKASPAPQIDCPTSSPIEPAAKSPWLALSRKAAWIAGLGATALLIAVLANWNSRPTDDVVTEKPFRPINENSPTSSTNAAPSVNGAPATQIARWPFDPLDGVDYEWGAPKNLGESINTPREERLWSITPDELGLYFFSRELSFAQRKSVADSFGPGKPIAGLPDDVSAGTLSADGLSAVVCRSSRRAEVLAVANRTSLDSAFGESLHAPEPLNIATSPTNLPVLSPDGLTLIAQRVLPGEAADVWLFTRTSRSLPFADAVHLPRPVNTPDWEMGNYISDDRRFLIATSQAQNEARTVFLFTRTDASSPFSPGIEIDLPIFSGERSDLLQSLRLSGDGQAIYFESSSIPGGHGKADIWVCRRRPKATQPEPKVSPAIAIFPFSPEVASEHQQTWARYLNLPIEFTNSIGMRFRLIPPGEFTMGVTPEQLVEFRPKLPPEFKGDMSLFEARLPGQRVRLSRPFYLQTEEVRASQFQEMMGWLPDQQRSDLEVPDTLKHGVRWEDAAEFCNRLNARENKPVAYVGDGVDRKVVSETRGYRLPTEAEWEYACRAGTNSFFFFGDEPHGPDGGYQLLLSYQRQGQILHARPNPFGLIDLYGGADEWCSDAVGDSALAPSEKLTLDPLSVVGHSHIKRGGSFFASGGKDVRVNNSYTRLKVPLSETPEPKYSGLGRLVLPISIPRKTPGIPFK